MVESNFSYYDTTNQKQNTELGGFEKSQAWCTGLPDLTEDTSWVCSHSSTRKKEGKMIQFKPYNKICIPLHINRWLYDYKKIPSVASNCRTREEKTCPNWVQT